MKGVFISNCLKTAFAKILCHFFHQFPFPVEEVWFLAVWTYYGCLGALAIAMEAIGAGTPVRSRDLPLHQSVGPKLAVISTVELIRVGALRNATFTTSHSIHYLDSVAPLAFAL